MVRYTLADMFTLALTLAKPFTDAIKAEFATDAKPEVKPELVTPEVIEVQAPETPAIIVEVAVVTPETEVVAVVAEIVPEPETFYIKTSQGKNVRYVPASETAVGLRYRKIPGKKIKYIEVQEWRSTPIQTAR